MAKVDEFLEQLAALSYDPFFVIDRDRRVVYCNDLFAVTLGIRGGQRRRLEGRPLLELCAFDAVGEGCLADCLRGNRNVRVQGATARLADNRELILDLSASPLRDESGAVTGIIVLHRDVTDEHRLKQRYNQERQEHVTERESLLRIIRDRDHQLERLSKQVRRSG